MKKLLIILLFCTSVFAQERREYMVEEFTGGLNLVTDSIDLARNEAVKMLNFEMNRFGAGHKRLGFDIWNKAFLSSGKIWDIYYTDSKNGDKSLFFAANIYVLERKNWEDTTDWSGSEISYSRGIIDTAENDQRYIYGDTTSWILAVAPGDNIEFEGDIAQRWVIDSILADTILHINANLTSAHGDTTTYRIIKVIPTPDYPGYSWPQLSSWGGKLYVANANFEPWWYDGVQPQLLGIIDSGTVTTAAVIDTTVIPYKDGIITLRKNSNIVFFTGGDAGGNLGDVTGSGDSVFATGNNLKVALGGAPFCGQQNFPIEFSATITGINVADSSFYISNTPNSLFGDVNTEECLSSPVEVPDTTNIISISWQIEARDMRITTKQFQYVEDTTKFFPVGFDINYIGFWIVNGNNALKRGYISSNTQHVISFDSTGVGFTTGDRYYIVRQIPELRNPILGWGYSPYPDPWGDDPFPLVALDTTYTELTYFRQIIFHRNRLYAIGYGIVPKASAGFAVGDTVNTGRVWFSALGQPRFIHSDWNFDLSGVGKKSFSSLYSGDDATTFFVLRNDLYVITRSSIYRISGEPPDDLYIAQVIHGFGTIHPNGIVTTRDNVAYIMNQQGIWLFNGNSIEKISYKIDPLVEKYRESRMVAGQFKDNLFFSYPDSNVTIVMHDPTKAFTTWDIGMLTINVQSVAIDSNYFLFSRDVNSSYVLKYPRNNSIFTDILSPTDTTIIVADYLSGHQTLGIFRDKILQDIEITAYNPEVSVEKGNILSLYKNFGVLSWYDSTFAGGTRIHLFDNIGNISDSSKIMAKTFQIGVKDSTAFDFFLSNYLLRWYPADGK